VKEKFLKKLIDKMILPLVLLIAARYLGIFLASYLITIKFSFSSDFNFWSLPFIRFESKQSLITSANSVSWLVVYLALIVIFGFVLLRNLYFHEHLIHPKFSAKLHIKRLEFLIVDYKEAFYQATAWFILNTIISSIVIAEFLSGLIINSVFTVAVSGGLILLVLYIAEAFLGEKLASEKI